MIIALVSVPYRGILFFNRNTPRYIYIKHSFRPLSGNLIFQFENEIRIKNATMEQFPSPIGESYFSIPNKNKECDKKYCQSFRPLSGNLIFQS